MSSGTTAQATASNLFKLLKVLIQSRGPVLSRGHLVEQVWSAGTYCTDRVVDTHVSNLRKKIEPDPFLPCYMSSVRGLGYRFDG